MIDQNSITLPFEHDGRQYRLLKPKDLTEGKTLHSFFTKVYIALIVSYLIYL